MERPLSMDEKIIAILAAHARMPADQIEGSMSLRKPKKKGGLGFTDIQIIGLITTLAREFNSAIPPDSQHLLSDVRSLINITKRYQIQTYREE